MSRRQSAADGVATTSKSAGGRGGSKPAHRPSGADRRRATAKAAAAAADPNAPTGILGADMPPDGSAPTPFLGTAGRQKRPFGLQPFAWGGLQILPLAPAAAATVAAIPPPLPGMTRSAVFR